MSQTKLEIAFQDAVCVETTTQPADQVECGCGAIQTGTGIQYGTFGGVPIIHGCRCQASSNFGGMLWAHRHALARFLRNMTDALRTDLGEVEAVLPREIGEEQP